MMQALSKLILLSICLISPLPFFMDFSHEAEELESKTEPIINKPYEKIYGHIDRPMYYPGESIWFKAYVVDLLNQPSFESDVMIAELIAPNGSVILSKRLKISDGASYGTFKIDKNKPGGIYKVKMYTNFMRNFGEDHFFTKDITVQKVMYPRILQELKFMKEAYGPGSEVFADYEIKDLQNKAINNRAVKYVVEIDGKPYLNKKTRSNKEGKIQIHFKLPKKLENTDAILNVMVDHRGNQESISKSIPILLDNIELQFLPESGPMIANAPNVIAFKALNEFGKPADISGTIVDENNKEYGAFHSYHDGMGKFNFIPETDKQYFAKIRKPFKSDSLYQLPKSQNMGIRFSVEEGNKLSIYSSKNQHVWVVSSIANSILEEKKLSVQKGVNYFSFKNNQQNQGIIKYAIHDLNGTRLAERLAFINYDQDLDIQIKLEKENFDLRESIKAKIKTKDSKGNPVPSNLSIGITDNKLVQFADDKQDDISSYLLMSSELKGDIYKPNFYFDQEEEKAEAALDLVLLTHGWRSYLNEEHNPNAITIKAEKFNEYKGQCLNKAKEPMRAEIVVFENSTGNALNFETKSDGQFKFKMKPNQYYSIVAYHESGEKVHIINKTKNNQPVFNERKQKSSAPIAINLDKVIIETEYVEAEIIEEPEEESAMVDIALMEGNLNLDEVVVTAFGGNLGKKNLSSSSQILSGQIAGLTISPSETNMIRIRGNSSISGPNAGQPLYVIDGIPIRFNSVEELRNINSFDIESVEVMKGDVARHLYGSRASKGAVIINSNNTIKLPYHSKHLTLKKHKNYTVTYYNNYNNNRLNIETPVSFYSPIYKAVQNTKRTDFRKTLYWNPVVQTDENGEAEINFFSSDEVSSFIITAEGITANGQVGRKEKLFSTSKGLSITYKSPKFVTVDDTIHLKILVSNELNEEKKVDLNLEIGDEFKIMESFKLNSIQVYSKGFKEIEIPIIAKTIKTNSKISISLESGKYYDAMEKSIDIISPYFPSSYTIANNKPVNQKFKIPALVKGSMDATLHVYTSSLTTTMDGIEGMLGAPHGCFEQTSSYTYPNVLVLQYLRENGISNPEIEKKALKYIRLGYDRLMSFESKNGGFEWWGGNPASETLTAYGLLEFSDMKKVYPEVSDEMIKRTVKWLMSRRDGKGGFIPGRRFSACSEDIANAYIIYGLSSAKLNVDIEKEYKAAYQDALSTKDVYKMALMALSSHNLNKFKQRDLLNDLLIAEIGNEGFEKVEIKGSMTGSYYNNVKVETAALIVMSLLKAEKVNNTVLDGMNFILKSKRGFRYGSTQATCLALQAIIEYAKVENANRFAETDSVRINVNGHEFSKSFINAKQGKIVFEDLDKYLNEGIQDIHVSFSNSKVHVPFAFQANWSTYHPRSQEECALKLSTQLQKSDAKISETVRMEIQMKNRESETLASPIAIIGIPSGTSVQPWQLKELVDNEAIAFYELHDNELVLYWRKIAGQESININLDLKAELAGNYQASASRAYLYYGDEYKHWVAGTNINIEM